MANGEATVTFEGVNLDYCIKHGLEFTGFAKCPNCKQIYTFEIRLDTKDKPSKFMEIEKDGKTATVPVPDSYSVVINFSLNRDLIKESALARKEKKAEREEPCVPCSHCTPNCPKLFGR